MASSLSARTKGSVAQYQSVGKSGVTGVTPRDSGNILGTVPPGKAGIKLVSGVIQNAADLAVDGTAGVTGNALLPTSGRGVTPTLNTAQAASAGLSLAPEHE
jgi:hypothetical protein